MLGTGNNLKALAAQKSLISPVSLVRQLLLIVNDV